MIPALEISPSAPEVPIALFRLLPGNCNPSLAYISASNRKRSITLLAGVSIYSTAAFNACFAEQCALYSHLH